MKTFTQIILGIALTSGIASISKAQLLTNNGALVTVQTGAVVHVYGEIVNKDNGANQGIINNSGNVWARNGSAGFFGDFTNISGSEANLTNGSGLYVARNYYNDATLVANNGSTVYFNGSTNQLFERGPNANINDSFYNVQIDNSAGGDDGVELKAASAISNMVVRNNLDFVNGIVKTDVASNYVHVINSVPGGITGYDNAATVINTRYIAGRLKRNLGSTVGYSVDFPIGDLPSGKQMQLLNYTFDAVPDYTNLTAHFVPAHTGSPVATAECGNDGYDAWIGNGRWIVVPGVAGSAQYDIRVHPRNYTALYATLNYTQYTGNASATVAKAPTSSTAWALDGVCVPASTLNPMASAVVYRGNINTGFSEFAVQVDDDKPFPVEMLPLVAVPDNQNQIIKLYWKTASEKNNAGFEIQRSTDGVNFSKIDNNAWVNGQGNSSVLVNYQYDDVKAETNVRYYYKLKQVDNNGAFQYSNIAEAILSKDFQFGVVFYPNPTSDALQMTISSDKEQIFTINVYNAIGQQVAAQSYSVKAGANTISLDFFSNMSFGTYTAVVSNGENIVSTKIIKNQ